MTRHDLDTLVLGFLLAHLMMAITLAIIVSI